MEDDTILELHELVEEGKKILKHSRLSPEEKLQCQAFQAELEANLKALKNKLN
jgi:hypothetical protein